MIVILANEMASLGLMVVVGCFVGLIVLVLKP